MFEAFSSRHAPGISFLSASFGPFREPFFSVVGREQARYGRSLKDGET